MVDCPHIVSSVAIDSVNLSQLQVWRYNCEESPENSSRSSSRRKIANIESEKVQWNCVVCDSFDSPWLCLQCGLVFCGRYVKGHGLSHSTEALCPPHCVSMQCNTYELFCYVCDDYVGGDTKDGKIHSVQRSLSHFNKYRCADHSYAARLRSGYFGSNEVDDLVDLETEEEDEVVSQNAAELERVVQTDEDSGSVLEEESVPVMGSSSTAPPKSIPGELIGGRTLRPRKRKFCSTNVTDRKNQVSVLSVDSKLRGLKNLGNTCFMNSVIQALGVTDVFREYLTQLPLLTPDDDIIEDHHSPITCPQRSRYNTRRANLMGNSAHSGKMPVPSFLAEELRKVLLDLCDFNRVPPVSPDDFFHAVWKISPRFRGYHQQDAHEFLRCALDRLHCELRRCRIPESADAWLATACGISLPPSASAVSRIFEGSIQSQVVCLTCHTASNKHETFMDLSLDIYEPLNGRAGRIHLWDCIHKFFAKEELGQCEQYMCGHCKDKRPSTKQLMLRVLPNVLCIHLKRFRWSHMSRGKLDYMVDFPLSGLDITPFMATTGVSSPSESVKFDLTSVVVHHGSDVGSGHYSTYGRRKGSWFHFNDSSVKPCSEQTVLKQKAYLLFYSRSC